MPTPNFRGRERGDRMSASTMRSTTRKDEGFQFSLDQRCEGELLLEVVTVHCFSRADGTLMTRVTVKGHKPIELVTVRG